MALVAFHSPNQEIGPEFAPVYELLYASASGDQSQSRQFRNLGPHHRQFHVPPVCRPKLSRHACFVHGFLPSMDHRIRRSARTSDWISFVVDPEMTPIDRPQASEVGVAESARQMSIGQTENASVDHLTVAEYEYPHSRHCVEVGQETTVHSLPVRQNSRFRDCPWQSPNFDHQHLRQSAQVGA
jgi:hypothetical protein